MQRLFYLFILSSIFVGKSASAIVPDYEVPLFPEGAYNDAIPSPDTALGFEFGSRAAMVEEIDDAFTAWAETSDRVILQEFTKSYTDRPLHVAIVSSPGNLAKLDSIRASNDRLADPRGLSDREAARLVEETPSIAWFGYGIHGDETSASDGAVGFLYYLAASEDPEVIRWLETTVVLVAPMLNPDGRERYLSMVVDNRSEVGNVDDRDVSNRGYWPGGRTNQYLFDLNRDWIYAAHPEVRGAIALMNTWEPQLVIDAHEMGSQDTFLFSPPREPLNLNRPDFLERWGKTFAADHAAAFNEQGWLYYTGEWHEEWYPGYTTAYSALRGAVPVLYEMSHIGEDAVKRPGGRITTYAEGVHTQLVSSIANLRTFTNNRAEVVADFVAHRREAVSPDGPFAGRIFAFPFNDDNHGRRDRLIALLEAQAFEFLQLTEPWTVTEATDTLGRLHSEMKLPTGTLVLPALQPRAHLLTAMMEFDPPYPLEAAREEYKELIHKEDSLIYDVTAWNIPMMFGLEAYEIQASLPTSTKPWTSAPFQRRPLPTANYAYAIAGHDDRALVAAARLLALDIELLASEEETTLSGQDLPRGSFLLTVAENGDSFQEDAQRAKEITDELGIDLIPLDSGLGEGELADVGGRKFSLLKKPEIGLLTRGQTSVYSAGGLWFLLDQTLGIPHSLLNGDSLEMGSSRRRPVLERYNVILLPSMSPGALTSPTQKRLMDWVDDGGTLIALGSSVSALTQGRDEQENQIMLLKDAYDELDSFETDVLRQWMAQQEPLPPEDTFRGHVASTDAATFPWSAELERPEEDAWKREIEWSEKFLPAGAMLAARVDPEHWLTAGIGPDLPVLMSRGPLLLSRLPIESPVRLGVFEDAQPATDEAATPNRLGWSALPYGQQMRLRASGLLWPEAAPLLANASVVTRESRGRGQIILFATSPGFRAATAGTERLLLNAIVYGPGMGTRR